MKKSWIATVTFVLFLTLVCFQGCSENTDLNKNTQNIQNFLKSILTIPSEEFSGLVTSDLHLTDMEEYDRQVNEAIASLCGEHADIEKLSDTSSRFFSQVILSHLMADYQQYTVTVDQIVVKSSEDNDKQYGYEAVLHDSREDEPVTITDSIQLNDAYKMDYISIN